MRGTMKRLTILLAGFALFASACTPADDAAPPDDAAPADTPADTGTAGATDGVDEPADPGEATVVQLWSNAWFPSSIEGRMALVDKFNEEYDGEIFIEYIQGDGGQGPTYIQSGVAAGEGIACIMEWYMEDAGSALDWYRQGWVQDLGPYVTDERRALMSEEQWEARTAEDGAIVGNGTVLWEPSLLAFYNPDHFDEAGIEAATAEDPWTWDEWYENARLLTDAENDKWGYLVRMDPGKAWFYGMTFAEQRMGQPIVREEDGVWGWYLDDPEAIEAYEAFLTTVEQGVTPEWAIGIDGDTVYQSLIDGVASMIIYESFAGPIMSDNNPDFDFGVMPTPRDPGAAVPYSAGGEGMVITEPCDTPEEAAEFMFWMMEPENLAVYAYGNGMAPANFDALNSEPFASDSGWDPIRDLVEEGEVFPSDATNPNLAEFQDLVAFPGLMSVVEGERSFEEVNAELHERSLEILNQ